MSGHNKWSKIRHKKAVTDAVRSKIFSKHAKLITVAVKDAGGDLNSPSVVAVVEKAKKDNMPKDNIDRALKKGSDKDSASLETVMYEGYGPLGVGMIVMATTDNRNRTGQEVKHIFTKNECSLGAQGSVSWGFTKNKKGDWVANEGTEISLDKVSEQKLERMIEEFEDNDDITDVFVNAA